MEGEKALFFFLAVLLLLGILHEPLMN